MRKMFILDMEKCISCGACVVACMDQNDIEPRNGDSPFRQTVTVEEGRGKSATMTFLSLGCMHCENAPCIQACPAGCIRKDPDTNLTVYDNTNCIGCHSCAMACPFAAPCFNREGKMVKCDGCIERVKAGLLPACVKVCPFQALRLVDEEEYNQMERKKKARLIVRDYGKMTQEICK